jgi:hypothetical protein
MTRFRLILIGFMVTVAASCIITTGAAGGGTSSGAWISDSAGKLSGLAHFRAEVTIATKAQASGETIDRTDSYSLAVWKAEKAAFETVDSWNDDGQEIFLTLGTVDKAGYALLGGNTGCQTFWDDTNIKVDAGNLSPLLYPLKSGSAAGDETVNGIAAHAYSINSDFLGLNDVKASGKVWMAVSGGYLVKYHVELSGGTSLFGEGATGTRTVDFELSEVNSGAPVSYPGDCLPVLTDIPATDDAQDVQRMPGNLRYSSGSSPDQVQSFYEKYFSGQKWIELDQSPLPEGGKDILFTNAQAGRQALLSLQSQGRGTIVRVLTTGGASPVPAATPTGGTPAGNAELPASARIITSLATLLGNEKTPSPLGSFALTATEIKPAASGPDTTTMQAEVQGANVHFILTSGGETTDAILFEGNEYNVVGGKAQPGSAMLSATWSLWQLDPLMVLSAVGMGSPRTEAGTTLEGRPADVYSVDTTNLGGEGQDSSFGLLPLVITSIKGTVWIDHDTGALLKADLQFEASVRKPGESTPGAHGKGEFHLAVSQIGKVTVALPK